MFWQARNPSAAVRSLSPRTTGALTRLSLSIAIAAALSRKRPRRLPGERRIRGSRRLRRLGEPETVLSKPLRTLPYAEACDEEGRALKVNRAKSCAAL